MFESLKGKKVLITGSSGGIGAAIALLFAQYGAEVGLHYCRNKKGAQNVAKKIIRQGLRTPRLFQGDLLLASTRNNLVKKFIKAYGGIDVLVNNAGAIYDYKHFSVLTEKSWDKTLALNAKAPFYLIRQAFEYMRNHAGGRIINISTAAVRYGGSPYNMHYCVSKAGLDILTKSFSRQGAKYGILVNSICCGLIDTPMQDKIPGYRKEKFLQRLSLVPLKRAGTPEDVAPMAVFLASEGADFITGEFFYVSGGD